MTMKTPRIRLGNDDAWVELVQTGEGNQTGEENWRVTADWCSWMTADFPAYLSIEEATDFAARMLSHLRHPSGLRFSAAVTSGRNNPLTLTAEPVEDGYELPRSFRTVASRDTYAASCVFSYAR
jgi:hypothetical protein